MAPTGRGVPGVWKQSRVVWAIKDMMCYAAAVKFLNQCRGPGAAPRSQEITRAQLVVLNMNPQNWPIVWG